MQKGHYKKLTEDYPECIEEIKKTYGYQAEMLGKQLDKLMEIIISEFKVPMQKLAVEVRKYYGFKQRIKRFIWNFKYAFWWLYWWLIIKWDNLVIIFKNSNKE
jgi:hypothetical protein